MAELLRSWLADAGVETNNLEQDFANGCLFGRLLHAFNLQPDIDKFTNKGKPDAYLNNYTRLQPTLTKLGVPLDTRTAQALINKEPGIAGKMLYSIKQALSTMDKNTQALNHTGRTIKQFGMQTSPSRGMLDAQHYNTQQTAYQSGNLKFFEDVLRKQSPSPNALMESMHLKRFADEGSRQAAAATEGAALETSMKQAQTATRRNAELGKLAASRVDKKVKLQRDEAVHASLLQHQDDLERQELRVEMAMSELSKHKKQEAKAAAAAEAAAGIDAFEMTLKRLGDDSSNNENYEPSEQSAGPCESPLATLGRIRSFAPTAAKLAESGGEYLATIKARRQEEVTGRKEREARRRRLLVEHQAARSTAEGRMESESLLEVLVRRSGEEQKLGQRLWQLRQEKAAMEADRKLREQQYAAMRDKDWEETIRREMQLHRSLKSQFDSATQQELATWRDRQQQIAAAKAAKHQAIAQDVTWQLVQLAERAIEYRAATAGQGVPRRDWKAWISLFLAGDPSLGTPIVPASPAGVAASSEPESARLVMNAAELKDYLACQGEWTLPPDGAASSSSAEPQKHAALGRVVAELAALTQKLHKQHEALPVWLVSDSKTCSVAADKESDAAAGAAPVTAAAAVSAAETAHPAPAIIQAMPLKLAVIGGPFVGKTTVASALAQRYGIKLLIPEQLVTDAVAAAQAWEQQQARARQQIPVQAAEQEAVTEQLPEQQDVAAAVTVTACTPPKQVQLGQRVLQDLQQGSAVSDERLVELLVAAMLEANSYAPPPPEPLPEVKGGKGARGKGEAPPVGKGGAASAVAGSLSSGGAASAGHGWPGCDDTLPPHLAAAAGTQGRGFVLDGFPATARQAVLLEKALIGLDLEAEQALVDGASVVAPPPLDVLPQLKRPLVSGLDAVLVLGCKDEALAVKRALGRRLDPTTGCIYHLDFDPPPANVPGLSERLVMVTGPDHDTEQVLQRLASYSASVEPLLNWLCRFSTLQRPLDGSASLGEVLAGASSVAAGILVAKKAAHAARATAEAAHRARASAEKAKDYAHVAQGHAEGAARELLAAKRTEIQAAALLNGGKNPDPASNEVLKAQAAAKCAEQLKVCRFAATDAAGHADKAKTAAESASVAVQRCKLAVGDAAVSADAEATATKAAIDAEAAANAAIEASKKTQAAKQLAEAYVAEAEKWFAATDVQPDAAIPSAQQLAATAAGTAESTAAAPDGAAGSTPPPGSSADTSSTTADTSNSKALLSPALLPAAVVPLLHEEWQLLEQVYVDGMQRGFEGLRQARNIALAHVAGNCSWFSRFLKRADGKQVLLQGFQERFNAVELDMRKAKETQGELLLRCEELRDSLWSICDAKHEEAEAARLKLASDGSAAEQIGLLGQHLTSLAQVELDRFLATSQFLYSYCHYAQGIYSLPGAGKPLCPQPTALLGLSPEPSKPEPPGKAGSAPPPPAYLISLQQRLPQLAAALKAATTAAAATQSSAKALIEDASKKVSAAAANAAAAASAATAAAAAAAAAGQSSAGAHKQGTGAGGKVAGTGAAAALSTAGKSAAVGAAAGKLVVGSEEAAAAAAATAAAAAAAVAAMPQPAALAAVAAELQGVVAQEVQLLQQRLTLIGTKAAATVDEVVQLQAVANCQLAEWQQKRYVAECGAVAALERVVKAAAAAGQPLPHDLRLEDDFLVIDESQLLVPPAPTAVPARPATPPLPPGVMSVQQLQQLADAFMQAAPGGYLAVASGMELMLRMACKGVLPASWQDIDATHMSSALSAFDPTFSGYLNWREVMLALAASTLPAIHAATAAQIAVQAEQLAAADADADGCLTQQEFDGVTWWFEPKAEAVQAVLEEQMQDEAVAGVMREVGRCKVFKQLLWQLFQQATASTATAGAAAVNAASSASRPASPVRPVSAAAAAAGSAAAAVQVPSLAKAAASPAAATAQQSQPDPPSTAGAAASGTAGAEAAMGAAEASDVPDTSTQSVLFNAAACLLYLCPDRDLYQGITKAVAAVTRSAAAGASVDAAAVVRMCYPLLTPEQAAPIQRAPLTAAQISAAIAAAAASDGQPAAVGVAAAAPAAASLGGASTQAASSAGLAAVQAAAQAAAQQAAALAAQPVASVKASQLMYSAACERVVTLLLHRYQWKDVYIAARL